MAKSTATCNSILALVFNATAWANIAQNGDSPLTNLWIALYTDDPGLTDDPTINEATYGNYQRKSTTRDTDGTTGWKTPAGGITKNLGIQQFLECNGSTNIITYVGIVTSASGPGHLLYKGTISSPRTISTGIQPQFAAEALVVTET